MSSPSAGRVGNLTSSNVKFLSSLLKPHYIPEAIGDLIFSVNFCLNLQGWGSYIPGYGDPWGWGSTLIGT